MPFWADHYRACDLGEADGPVAKVLLALGAMTPANLAAVKQRCGEGVVDAVISSAVAHLKCQSKDWGLGASAKPGWKPWGSYAADTYKEAAEAVKVKYVQ